MSDGAERLLLSARGIGKRFGGVRALDDVGLDVRAGEVHGLIGANGAGKSTLIGVLSGAITPDAGQLTVNGRDVPFGSIAEARRAGIAVVHQELMLFPDLTVEENIAATALPTRASGFINRRQRRRAVRRVLDNLGVAIDLAQRVAELPLPAAAGRDRPRALRRRRDLRPRRADFIALRPGGGRSLCDDRGNRRRGRRGGVRLAPPR
jgi:ABC-type sugar transport system ATPase subunit